MEQTVGIMGWGTSFPEGIMDAAEIAERSGIPVDVIRDKFGVNQKPVASGDETTAYLGLEAARKAIKKAGIEASEIDIVIWNGGQQKDYPCWLAGLKIAEDIGAVNAWSFDMEAMCGSMMVGMEVAKSLLLGNARYRTVLLVSGYRNGDFVSFDVPATSFMFDIGAGGSAMIIRKGYEKNLILGTAFKGDGSFSEECIVPVGGTKKWPMTASDVENLHFEIPDPDLFKKKLGERTLPNFFEVIAESMKQSGFEEDDIDYLAILHFKKSTHDYILEHLKLSDNQTTYLDQYGHIGQNDQIISLEEGLKAGKIKNGDKIVMVGAGIGFVWASAVVQWG
ncbi:MAG TPA: hypothetical protein DCO79_06105 [Spirochaeta sp.]|nr:hypothetical protein [Spirochaeta sp.]